MKKIRIPVAALGAILLAGCTMNGTNNNDNMSGNMNSGNMMVTGTSDDATNNDNTDRSDAAFVSEAMAMNKMEISMLTMGMQMGTNAQLKGSAEMMLNDHNMLDQQMAAYAAKMSINLTDDDADDANDMMQNDMDALADEARGADRDKKWLDEMIDAHQKTIDLFEDEEDDVDDAELNTIIKTTLPTLRKHLEDAKTLRDSMN